MESNLLFCVVETKNDFILLIKPACEKCAIQKLSIIKIYNISIIEEKEFLKRNCTYNFRINF